MASANGPTSTASSPVVARPAATASQAANPVTWLGSPAGLSRRRQRQSDAERDQPAEHDTFHLLPVPRPHDRVTDQA